MPGIDVDGRVFADVADPQRPRRIAAAIPPGVEAYFGALLGEVREDQRDEADGKDPHHDPHAA
jgi:hypothetical protein